MIRGKTAVLELIDLFKKRKVTLYHACQLKDFRSYLQLGGIPSRALMESNGLSFTSFRSDASDKTTDTWDKVFLNLSDFGNFFHNGTNSIPNVYGPILIRLDPECIEDASDVAICLRSASGAGFNRDQEALTDTASVDRIFTFPATEKGKTFWVKQSKDLKKTFSTEPRIIVDGSPEISCSFPNQLISINYFTSIIVDPVNRIDAKLINIVKEAIQCSKYQEFSSTFGRSPVDSKYRDLVDAVAIGVSSLKQIQRDNFSAALKLWARNCDQHNLDWIFDRFSEYLRLGTIEEVEEIGMAEGNVSS